MTAKSLLRRTGPKVCWLLCSLQPCSLNICPEGQHSLNTAISQPMTPVCSTPLQGFCYTIVFSVLEVDNLRWRYNNPDTNDWVTYFHGARGVGSHCSCMLRNTKVQILLQPWLPLINTILHANDLFKMESVIVVLKGTH